MSTTERNVRRAFTVTETPRGTFRIYSSWHMSIATKAFLNGKAVGGIHDFRDGKLLGWEFSAENILYVWDNLSRGFNSVPQGFGMKHEEMSPEFWYDVSHTTPPPEEE